MSVHFTSFKLVRSMGNGEQNAGVKEARKWQSGKVGGRGRVYALVFSSHMGNGFVYLLVSGLNGD
jgi:hypothetical protein